MRENRYKSGYTLVETIIAAGVMSLVIIMVYSSWSAVLGAHESSILATQNSQRERMAMKAIEEALAGASWYNNHKEASFELSSHSSFSRLKITSRVPPGFWGERELEAYPLRRIEFIAEPTPSGGHQLVMVQQPLVTSTNSVKKPHRTILLKKAARFVIEVKPPRAKAAAQWKSFWSDPFLGGGNGLPGLARVSLGASMDYPRRKIFPVFASMATHAEGPPGIGTVTNIGGFSFSDSGFQPEDSAGRLVFLIDKSGSMLGGQLQMAKEALFKSLEQMDDKGNFYIYFYNHGSDGMRLNSSRENPGMRSPMMLEANAANISKVKEWINNQRARGGTNPTDSLKSAFTHKPTELYLLTDGEFITRRGDPKVREQIQSLNADRATIIHTLAVGDSLRGTEAEATLMLIAKENGGTYTFIDPQAAQPMDLPGLGNSSGKTPKK